MAVQTGGKTTEQDYSRATEPVRLRFELNANKDNTTSVCNFLSNYPFVEIFKYASMVRKVTEP